MTQSGTMVPVIFRNYLLSAMAKTTSGQFCETIWGGPFTRGSRFCSEIKALKEEGRSLAMTEMANAHASVRSAIVLAQRVAI
ncbi:hypothetical protein TNCT_691861 [Trichonephila clavata]|uniref:Uncharacterized protein n=1 Tax=Trichonephila clavata TaxID=2740835 RepID=A0A8X6LRB3_TRICU|nr:hypothetical protein TNCT_691861 [Trichonephila clavata]